MVGFGLAEAEPDHSRASAGRPARSSSWAISRWVAPDGARSVAWRAISASTLPSMRSSWSMRSFAAQSLGFSRRAAAARSCARVQPVAFRTSAYPDRGMSVVSLRSPRRRSTSQSAVCAGSGWATRHASRWAAASAAATSPRSRPSRRFRHVCGRGLRSRTGPPPRRPSSSRSPSACAARRPPPRPAARRRGRPRTRRSRTGRRAGCRAEPGCAPVYGAGIVAGRGCPQFQPTAQVAVGRDVLLHQGQEFVPAAGLQPGGEPSAAGCGGGTMLRYGLRLLQEGQAHRHAVLAEVASLPDGQSHQPVRPSSSSVSSTS